MTENCWTSESTLEKMLRSRKLHLPKAAQKPNSDKNPLGDHESIFTFKDDQGNKWDHPYTYRAFTVRGQTLVYPYTAQKFMAYGKTMKKICMKLRKIIDLLKQVMMIYGRK